MINKGGRGVINNTPEYFLTKNLKKKQHFLRRLMINASNIVGTPPSRGLKQPIPVRGTIYPREATFRWSLVGEFGGEYRGRLWGSRGTITPPRGVEWRSREPVFIREYYNRNSFKDPKRCRYQHRSVLHTRYLLVERMPGVYF